MRTIITTIICFSCLFGSAQKSDKNQKEIKDQYYTCKYTIDKKSKLKDGEFIQIKNSTQDTLVIGQYKNDQKAGLWKYKTSGNKDYILYNYDKKSVEYLAPAISKVDSFLVIEPSNGIYFLNKVDSPPVYLGYNGEMKTMMNKNLIVPAEEGQRGVNGVSTASFVIDTTGRISEIMIERSLSKSIDKMLINAIKMIDGEWVPAKVNNVPVNSKMNVLVYIHGPGNYPKFKEKPYEIVRDLTYYRRWVQKTYSTSREISVPVSSPMGGARTTF
jgi:protein TonB